MKSYKTFIENFNKKKKNKKVNKVHQHDINRPEFHEFTASDNEDLNSIDNDFRQ